MERLTGRDAYGDIVADEEMLILASRDITYDDLHNIINHLAEKLCEYEDLEEQDRLLKLPCKVGDTVYWINGKFIVDYKITGFSVDEDGVWLMYVEHYDKAVDKTYSYNIAVDTIGKIAFFSKSEAEAKLKELRNIENSKNINLDNDDFERM